MNRVSAFAPGRVNLIGEYTDLIGGRVLPIAIDLGTTVDGVRGGAVVELRSDRMPDPAIVPLGIDDPSGFDGWSRHVAGIVAELRPTVGFRGEVRTSLPIGSGLSSSAALGVAIALALGFRGSDEQLARLARRAEQRATGVPCGIMDQLASVAGRAGHALAIDCSSLAIEPVPIPGGIEIRIVDSGITRELAASAYGRRKAAIDEAVRLVGPLTEVDDPGRLDEIRDPTVRRRARHVVTEHRRVAEMIVALRDDDRAAMGRILAAGQRSLRDDLEVSLPAIDDRIRRITSSDGVIGARLTGAGFGGAIVVLAEAGAIGAGRRVVASGGARRSG